MWLAYNTNGLAHHRFEDALRLLADLGYGGVALTPDVGHLDLMTTGEREWEAARALVERLRLRVVVETGARYVLEPRRKHWPNLLSSDAVAAQRRLDFYRRAMRLAKALGGELVSIWSGAADDEAPREELWRRLTERMHPVLDDAAAAGVTLCFEPEPGMFVDSLAQYRELRARLLKSGRDDLATTIDVGHLLVTEPGAPHDHLAEFAPSLKNIQLDDARRGVHEHLPLGEGEIDFARLIAELCRLKFAGPVALELSRDSHRGAQVAEDSIRRLRALLRA
jgi:L-ribulose-5-phosphate 3-epimerase